MNAILHLTDFSETAQVAYRYAISLARQLGKAIRVVHVYDRPYASIAYQGGLSAVIDAELDRRIRAELEKHLLAYVQAVDVDKVPVHAHLLSDYAVWRVEDYLSKFSDVDLIVVGTRGATSLWDGGILGTNTARLIRHSPLPVLAVHPQNSYRPYERVLLPIEVFEDKTIEVIQDAIRFLAAWPNVKVILSVINTPYVFFDTATINRFLDNLKAALSYPHWELRVYNDISVEEGLRQAMEAEKADLLIMGTHGRKGLAQFLFGSITENVVQHLAYPLLAIPLRKS